MIYDVKKERINIKNYSPFSSVNEISDEYKFNSFKMPFVSKYSREIPVHPDTFSDLKMKNENVIFEKEVFPTSSFRTVYEPEENICFKVPVLRRITRSIRDLPHKALKRSEKAEELLSKNKLKDFDFLREECYAAKDPNFNYIKRIMPKKDCFPWFYAIVSNNLSPEFKFKTASNIIKSWMFYASKGIFLEYHTQNILTDKNSKVYYRDLSDVRTHKKSILRPSYIKKESEIGKVLATIFDRTVCKQNLDHLFNNEKRMSSENKILLKELILSEIREHRLPFPNHSMDFPTDSPERIPEKTRLTWWRQEFK